ncbi:MAG: hypothetical protein ACXQTE_05650 [Methanosarcinaceae archaeon]
MHNPDLSRNQLEEVLKKVIPLGPENPRYYMLQQMQKDADYAKRVVALVPAYIAFIQRPSVALQMIALREQDTAIIFIPYPGKTCLKFLEKRVKEKHKNHDNKKKDNTDKDRNTKETNKLLQLRG